ncbi:MAG: heavy-metal-associated domain-containing protein [Gemmatimonadetes bacterium]|nr:heavy-metal-associated domain-containing protein [Gemmatimonadota bacterium]
MAAYASYVYNVSGMTCGGCASKIEAAVAELKLDSVKACEIDLDAATATVKIDGDVPAETATIIANAITEAGFKAEAVKAETKDADTATM